MDARRGCIEPGPWEGMAAAILIMDHIGPPGEGTRRGLAKAIMRIAGRAVARTLSLVPSWEQWMRAFGVIWERGVPNLDTPQVPRFHKPNRLWAPGRVMGESPDIHERVMGAPPALAGPRNISQAYHKRPKGGFSVAGRRWKVGQRRLVLSGGQSAARPALQKRFPMLTHAGWREAGVKRTRLRCCSIHC